jgi:hypothetical protein
LLAVTGRDKDATWRTLGTLCRELDWRRQRLLYELQNGRVPYRTVPPGHVVDWHRPRVLRSLDIEASEVTIVVLDRRLTVGIEVLPPGAPADAEVPALSANAPSASPVPPRKVSEAELRKALLAIVEEHPPGSPPLDEESLHKKVEGRLGAPVARERVLAARNEVAPHFKLPVGRPRKNAQ